MQFDILLKFSDLPESKEACWTIVLTPQQCVHTPSWSGSLLPFFMIRVKWLHRDTILNENCCTEQKEKLQHKPMIFFIEPQFTVRS